VWQTAHELLVFGPASVYLGFVLPVFALVWFSLEVEPANREKKIVKRFFFLLAGCT
jgi:hypothetical protein